MYDPEIVAVPANSWFAVNVTEQLPNDRVQEFGWMVPRFVLEVVKPMVPVGMLAELEVSIIVAVHLVEPPNGRDDELHVTVVLVPSLFVRLNVIVPLIRVVVYVQPRWQCAVICMKVFVEPVTILLVLASVIVNEPDI